MEWIVLDSRYALEHRWIKVRQDTCQLPNGTVIDDYFWLESPDYTLIVPVTPSGMVVLTKQYKHAAHQLLIEFPGGVIEPDEDPLGAAQRELSEETGYTGGIWHCLGVFYPNPTKSSARAHLFIAQGVVLSTDQALDPTEEIHVQLLPLAEVQPLLGTTGSTLALLLAGAYLAQYPEVQQ